MRLAKYLAHSGVASRRKAEVIIGAGRVRVDGQVVTDPAFGVEIGDDIRVDGHPVEPEGREVWMVNKPIDVISTADEPGKRIAVVDLVDSTARLYPVGRLDADSTGTDPAQQRRRTGQPADPPAIRGREDLPGHA